MARKKNQIGRPSEGNHLLGRICICGRVALIFNAQQELTQQNGLMVDLLLYRATHEFQLVPKKTSRLQNLFHQIINLVPPYTIFPLAPIPNTPDFAPNSNRTTGSYTGSLTPLNALPQQRHSLAHVADARIQLFKINSVLQSAALYMFPLGDFAVGG